MNLHFMRHGIASDRVETGTGVNMETLGLCLQLGSMGILTPHATGPSPVYYGSGYPPAGNYGRLGAISGVIFFAAFLIGTALALTGDPSPVEVTFTEPARYMRWSLPSLRRFMDTRPDLRVTLQGLVNRDLAEKLKVCHERT